MGLIVQGPFSGKPVKIRDQDVGRAVRDEEGRIFYVLPRSDGNGYYGAPTRAGNPRDEARALEMESKQAFASGNVREQVAAVHDARGRGRGSGVTGKLVVLFLLLLVIALFVFAKYGPMGDLTKQWTQPPPTNPIVEGGAHKPAP